MTISRLKIQFVTIVVEQDFYKIVKKGVMDAAKALDVDATFVGPVDVNADKMIALIKQGLHEGVDGFALCIFDADALRDIISEMTDKKIPVIAFNIDAGKGALKHLASIVQDFPHAGQVLGRRVFDLIPEGANVLVTEHDTGISALEERMAGIKRALEGRRINWFELNTTHDSEIATQKVTAYLRENEHITAALGTGLADTQAIARAVRRLDRPFLAAGFDLSPDILTAISDGVLQCTIDQQPYCQGFYALTQLVLNLRYGLQPSSFDAGATVIDQSNVQRVLGLSKLGVR